MVDSSPVVNAVDGALLAATLREINALIVFLDLDTAQVTLLEGAEVFGLTEERVTSLKPGDLLTPDDAKRVGTVVTELFAAGSGSATLEVTLQSLQGPWPVRMTIHPIRTDERRGVMAVLHDIREERRRLEVDAKRNAFEDAIKQAATDLALAPNDVIVEVLNRCAVQLAPHLQATTMAYWVTDPRTGRSSAQWTWPEEFSKDRTHLLDADSYILRALDLPNDLWFVTAEELKRRCPPYLEWVKERGGAFAAFTRRSSDGLVRWFTFHTENLHGGSDALWLSAGRNVLEVFSNAIDRRALTRTIEHNAKWSRTILENSSDMIAVLDLDFTFRYTSNSFKVLGYKPGELDRQVALDFVHPDDLDTASELVLDNELRVIRFQSRGGDWRHVECRVTNLENDPTMNGLVFNARDVSDRIRSEQALRRSTESQQFLATVTEQLTAAVPGQLLDHVRNGLRDLVAFVGCQRGSIFWNDQNDEIADRSITINDCGVPDEENTYRIAWPKSLPPLTYERKTDPNHPVIDAVEIPGLVPLRVLLAAPFAGPNGQVGTLCISSSDDSFEPHEASFPTIIAFAQIITAVLSRHAAENRLHRQATIDAVTGLANRTVMRERLEADLIRVSASSESVALLLLDLDDFKLVNDGYGHLVGDHLLRQFGERLEGVCGTQDLVSRLGGDEFVVIRSGPFDCLRIKELAESIHVALREPFVVEGRAFTISTSIGVSAVQPSQDKLATADLLRRADIAMYQAKQRGPGETEVFDDSMGETARGTALLRSDLEAALRNNELEVWFQPIVAVATGRVIGAEALVRWNHPRLGLLVPDLFIPLAERSGLIIALGEFVLDRSMNVLSSLNEQGVIDPEFYVSVNVAAPQLREARFHSMVAGRLAHHGLQEQQIRLEITESRLVDRALLASIRDLRDAGVRFGIDDFGTGYSSLASLQDLPVDVLKIDRSFVQRIDTDVQAAALVAAVITMANTLGLVTVAEGVETEGQRAVLASFGCPAAQGYLFARPMPEQQWVYSILSTHRFATEGKSRG